MIAHYPSATESMAARAWRYGEAGLPHWAGGDRRCYFSDGSRLSRRGVEDARAVREAYEWLAHNQALRIRSSRRGRHPSMDSFE